MLLRLIINKSNPPSPPSQGPQRKIDPKLRNRRKQSLHEGLQAAKNLVQTLNSLSNDGAVALANMTLRRGKKTLSLGTAEYFKMALSSLEQALETCAPKARPARRERY